MKKCKQCGYVVDDDNLMNCPQCGSNGPWLFPKRNPNPQAQMNNHSQQMNQHSNMYGQQGNQMNQQNNMYGNQTQMNNQMGNMQGNGGVQNVGGTTMPLTKKEIKEKKKAQQAQMRAQQQGNMHGNQMNQQMGNMAQASSGNGLMEPVMGVFDWLKLMICMSLPIVNIVVIIMAFVNKDTPKTKKNYIIAALIVMAVAVVLSLVASAIVTASIRSAVSSLY